MSIMMSFKSKSKESNSWSLLETSAGGRGRVQVSKFTGSSPKDKLLACRRSVCALQLRSGFGVIPKRCAGVSKETAQVPPDHSTSVDRALFRGPLSS